MSRRTFLAASASAAVAAPESRAAVAPSHAIDVVIVGAGAAGIAAARRVAESGRRYALLEASDHIGGRCVTDVKTFGVPFDRGAHWIHMPDLNPLAKLAPKAGVDIYPAPPGQRLRIGRRNAREGEMEDYLAALVRANRAIAEAARGKADVSCASVLPKDLGEWRGSIEFFLGPFGCAKALDEVSAYDMAKSAEREVDAFCRQGFGTLVTKLAGPLTVQLSTPVKSITTIRRGVEVQTAKGQLTARAAIITASTAVLAAGKIKFDPELPKRYADAVGKLTLGHYEHIAIELAGNPFDLRNDEMVFEKAASQRTGALLANIAGSTLCQIDVAGPFGKSLSAEGDAAMVAFATEWLADLYGAEVKKAVKRTAVTQWSKEPWVLGAFSAAIPGWQGGRKVLMEPIRDRIWFAGEAAHETLWGTVGGAWESGERAASEALKRIGR